MKKITRKQSVIALIVSLMLMLVGGAMVIFNPDMQEENWKIMREASENGEDPFKAAEKVTKNNQREVRITLIGAALGGISLPILFVGIIGLKKTS